MAKLTITMPDQAESRELELGVAAVGIGRDDKNALVVKDDVASRRHATIEKTPQGFLLKDLGSSNGTWVNQQRVQERLLVDGDEITIGRSKLVFSNPPEAERTMRFDPAMLQEVADQPAPPPPAVAAPAPQAPPPPQPPSRPQAPPPPAAAAPPPPAAPVRPSPPPAAAPPPPSARPVAPPPGQAPPRAAVSSAAATGNYAGFGIRLGAALIDCVIIAVPLVVLGVVQFLARRFLGPAVLLLGCVIGLAAFAFGVGYPLYFWATRGATPGKKMLGLRIVRLDGVEPMGYGKAFLRLVGYWVSSLILCIGYLMILFTEKKQGLHDMIAGTVVVKG